MGKKLIALMLSLCVIMMLTGCDSSSGGGSHSESSKKKEYDSPEEKIVSEALDKYFKMYEKCDIDGLNNVPTEAFCVSKERYESRGDMLDFDNVDELWFMYMEGIYQPLSIIRSADYLKSNHLDDFNDMVDEYYKHVDLKFDYKIIKIYEPDELQSISFKSGLDTVEADPEERVNNIFKDKEIEEWYGVTARVIWYINGDEYGLNDKLLDDMNEMFGDRKFGDEYKKQIKKMLENEGDQYDFIIVKCDGEWYVCPSAFMLANYSKSIVFVPKEDD